MENETNISEKSGVTIAQKYKDYENNKELVKDDNPYR